MRRDARFSPFARRNTPNPAAFTISARGTSHAFALSESMP
jgi:hypothetical protein